MTISEVISRKEEFEKEVEKTRAKAIAICRELTALVLNDEPEIVVKDKSADLDNAIYEFSRARFEYKIFMETEVVQKD